MPRETGRKLIAQNKKARHDFSIDEVFEAGLVLVGTEVKSLRLGRASLVDGFAMIDGGEAFLHNVHIPEYEQGTWTNHEPKRKRKMLLNRDEIRKISAAVSRQGYTLVPLSLYFKDGRVKVEIGLARGRKTHVKRNAIAERDASREMQKAQGRRSKGMIL
jgi:SsrA-binding protein